MKTASNKNVENIYPLSPLQEGLLFHSLIGGTNNHYKPQVVMSFSGELSADLFKQAWEKIIERHAVLRSGFYWEQRDKPFQIVFKEANLLWVELDWSAYSETAIKEQLSVLLEANRQQDFDLQNPALMRLQLIKTAENQYKMVWCYHHIILDGWSSAQLFKDVFQYYLYLCNEVPTVAPSPMPYANYISWINQQDNNKALNYWLGYLASIENTTLVSNCYQNKQVSLQTEESTALGILTSPYTPQQSQSIKQFCQQHSITLNTLMQATLGLLIAQLSHSNSALFGYTTSGRPSSLAGATEMVGLLINSLPIKVDISDELTVSQWLQNLQKQQIEASQYEFCSLREIQQHCNQGESLFDCLFVFESYPVDKNSFSQQQLLTIENLQFDEWTHYPLTLLITDGEIIEIAAKYQDNFNEHNIRLLLERWQHIINTLIDQVQQKLGNIDFNAHQKNHLETWNNTAKKWNSEQASLQYLLHQEHLLYSKDTAVIFENESLSYIELHQQAEHLKQYFIKSGITSSDVIAVYLPRSIELAVSLLAISKAGAIYLPIELSQATERINWIIKDAAPKAIIKNSLTSELSLSDNTLNSADLLHIDVSSEDYKNTVHNSDKVSIEQDNHTRINDNDIAYIIYTSGSTGKPKGVANTHRGIHNRLLWMQEYLNISAEDRILQKTPISFDVSIWELYLPLISGSTLVLAEPEAHKDPEKITDCIVKNNISILHFVPSMLDIWLENLEAISSNLKHVIVSGETLSLSTKNQFYQVFDESSTLLHNLYGPTEAAIDVSYWTCKASDKNVPIGHPIANTQLYILDAQLNPVTIGDIGELYIGSLNVAHHYINRPDLTADSFLPNPFAQDNATNNQCLMYKTGDLAYQSLADGAINYVGRNDQQVKVRGVRIELEELNQVIKQYTGIKQATSIVIDNHYIHSFVILDKTNNTEINESILLSHLSHYVVDNMLPKSIHIIEELPITTNGKLDRKQLIAIAKQAVKVQPYKAPSSPTELTLAAIWTDVMQLEKISALDDFFQLGGHSIIAMRIMSRVRREFELEVPMFSIFEHPVLEQFAKHIDKLIQDVNKDEADDYIELDLG